MKKWTKKDVEKLQQNSSTKMVSIPQQYSTTPPKQFKQKGFDHCLNCGEKGHSGLECPDFKESLKKAQKLDDVKKKTHSKTDLKPTSANALTKAAINYFSAKGFECWRNNNAAVWDKKNNCYRSNSAKKGVPDIIGYHKRTGQALWVEVKAGKDKLSTEQQQFLNDAEKANCTVAVIHSTDDLENFFKTQK